MNHTQQHTQQKLCHKKPSNASEPCFKEKKKRNIFQCFNVPFVNDELLLGDGGGWEETETAVRE